MARPVKLRRRGRWPGRTAGSVQSPIEADVGTEGLKLKIPVSPMNGTEEAWAGELEIRRQAKLSRWWGFQRIKLRLGFEAWYTPDFCEVTAEGRFVIYEVKGFWREAARVRIKVAAGLYPFFQFVAVRKRPKKDGGGWDVEEINAHHEVLEPEV